MNRLLLPTILAIVAILAVVGLSASNVFAQSQTSDAANGTQVQSSDSHENEHGDDDKEESINDHDPSSSHNADDDGEESEDDGDEELED